VTADLAYFAERLTSCQLTNASHSSDRLHWYQSKHQAALYPI